MFLPLLCLVFILFWLYFSLGRIPEWYDDCNDALDR